MDHALRSRWLSDSRRFAPWHYHEQAMLWKDQELIVPWASHKDQLQGFEKDYTAVNDTSEHDRHRLLANAWHLQVAKFMLMMILCHPERHPFRWSAEWLGPNIMHLGLAHLSGQLLNIDKLTIFGTIGRYHLNVVTLCWHHLTSNQVSCKRCTSVFHCSLMCLGCVSRLSRRPKTWLRHGRR